MTVPRVERRSSPGTILYAQVPERRPGWTARVQRAWAERKVTDRVKVLRTWRQLMAQSADRLVEAIAAGPARNPADVRVSELLPLLAACEFLEDNAEIILATRVLGRSGRPLWLSGVKSEIERVALGRVLIIAPSNYPLFLPGVQVLQALVAGNAVTWKPGRGGREVSKVFAAKMTEAGLPRELIRLTEESVEAGAEAVEAGAEKVFFTGSAVAGRMVMRKLAETGTPSVMELSDSSAVIVLQKAELGRVAAAVAFGIRLNGSATCMAPRRLLVMGRTIERREALVRRLQRILETMTPVTVSDTALEDIREMLGEAREQGATVLGEVPSAGEGMRPIFVVNATPEMRIAKADLFAPVLSVIDVMNTSEITAAQRACPFGLLVSIFGEENLAKRLALRMRVGTVVINDVIVPTADPRVPFGGRRASGFGVTRGAEGLLEMTAVKTVLVRSGKEMRHYEKTGDDHQKLFDGFIQAGHARTWGDRFRGLLGMAGAAQALKPGQKAERTTVEEEKQERYDRD